MNLYIFFVVVLDGGDKGDGNPFPWNPSPNRAVVNEFLLLEDEVVVDPSKPSDVYGVLLW